MAFKWADTVQAQERLQGTFLMYGEEVVYIEEVRASSAIIQLMSSDERKTVKLDDENWHDYRKIPPTGWINLLNVPTPRCVLLSRLPARVRRHGLTSDVVSQREISDNAVVKCRDHNLSLLFRNPGYKDLLVNSYPDVKEIVEKLPRRSSAAMSRKFAVYKDAGGVSWLFRRDEQVGFISRETLHVFPDTAFYKDEILEASPELSIKELL